MKILLDNGHGPDTPGKHSPDGALREYACNRLIARQIAERLQSLGYEATLIVPEDTDIPLPERCRRVNDICRPYGKDNVILISVHINASGNGTQWMTARGWSAYTTKGNTQSDQLATCLYKAAEKYLPGHKIRTDSTDGAPDLEENFYILRHLCPAVLTENLFMDNPKDCRFLLSKEGQEAIVNLHIEGTCKYLKMTG